MENLIDIFCPIGEQIVKVTGKRETGVFTGSNTVFFPQIGTRAAAYCQRQGISHVPVVSGLDYSLVMAVLAGK